MASIGERLKREREERGISLEEISAHTKIGVRLLKSIEADQFQQLPGGIFNKSFVRQYARCVGLEEEPIVRDYLQGGAFRETPLPSRARLAPPPAVPGYPRIILSAIGLGILIAGILFAIHRFSGGGIAQKPPGAAAGASENSGRTAAAPVAGESQPNPATAAGVPGAVSPSPSAENPAATPPAAALPQNVPAAAANGAHELTPSEAAPQELLLQIAAREPVWLLIEADGEKMWQGTLQPHETRQAKAAESIQLTVGDAGGVDLMLNGKSLPPLGRSGEVKRLTITPKDSPKAVP
jgi:cytoskeleton protein RodZ